MTFYLKIIFSLVENSKKLVVKTLFYFQWVVAMMERTAKMRNLMFATTLKEQNCWEHIFMKYRNCKSLRPNVATLTSELQSEEDRIKISIQ